MGQSSRSVANGGAVMALLVLAMFLNYVDRGSLSVAAPVLSKELDIGPARLGWLFSAFFWTYALGQIPSGWIVDKLPVRTVFAAGVLVWSAATLATGFVGGFASLFVCRLVLGLGESVAYPACSRILVRSVPEERRGVANSWIDAATKTGPAVSMLLGGFLVDAWGWRWLFWIAGAISLLWLPLWLALYRESGGSGPAVEERAAVSFGEILSRREAWGTSLAMFTLGYVWYLLLSWLPTYLVKARGFSMQRTAVMGALPLALMALGTLAAAWISDRLVARAGGDAQVRRRFLIAGLALTALVLPAAAVVENASLSLALLAAAHMTLGLFASNVWAVTQTLAGPAAAGRWTGIQNAVGNMGGVVSPLLTGIAVERTGSYLPAFASAAVMALLGAICLWLLVPRVAPVRWTEA